MDVVSVTGGTSHEKVVVMLHGGGASGSEWVYNFQQGWFGNASGLKYVFPTSPLSGHVWFNTYKNGCGLNADCAYDIPSIHTTATAVATLLEHEKSLVGGDATKVRSPVITFDSPCGRNGWEAPPPRSAVRPPARA